MGGRQASLITDELGVKGLICVAFPIHAAGREPGDRIEPLQTLKTPTLICQGTRETMGSQSEVEHDALAPQIRIIWLEDGDHSFAPKVKSGRTVEAHLQHVATQINTCIEAQWHHRQGRRREQLECCRWAYLCR